MGLLASARQRHARRLFTIPGGAAYNVRHTTTRLGVIVRAGTSDPRHYSPSQART
jgi:hypothetical protein